MLLSGIARPALTSITIPDSVMSVGAAMFHSCSSITSVTLPNSLSMLGIFFFQNCTSLTSVTIPDSVTVIGGNAFNSCTSLSSITIPDSVIRIEMNAFAVCTSLTSISIPDSVTSVDAYAFAGCTSLDRIRFIGAIAPTVMSNAFDYAVPTNGTIYYPVGATGYTDTWKTAVTGLQSWSLIPLAFQTDTNELVFASQIIGSSSAPQTITIASEGLTTDISCTLSGSGTSAFVLDAATLNPADGVLSVTFAPSAVGIHSATLTFSSEEAPGGVSATVFLSGTATSAPSTDSLGIDTSAQDSTTGTLPQTSDNTNALLFFATLLASGGALALLGFRARRRRKIT